MQERQPSIVPNAQRHNDVLWQVDEFGVATLTLNRTKKHNAFDACMIDLIIHRLDYLALRTDVRCLVLRSNGKHFSSGADLAWMQSMANSTRKENLVDAQSLARLMETLDAFPQPTIAVVQGSAFGGALGLICCSDIAIASHSAQFCLSEVKLGLVPATIAPYVMRAMGNRQARRYILSGEVIPAVKAQQFGIVHEVKEDDELESCVSEVVASLLLNSPDAMRKAKALCEQCNPIDSQLIRYTSQLIADIRVSPQGQDGLQAFLEKRPPSWVHQPDAEEK
ncbi:enoyl-CoA hydratase-related protein [Vibrio parahaemolyticus]|uniref:enoyl-CoA hydratase-related protein n=1 Tax=Vibrio parahaemolyticus TaxID=670 RepID=UPI00186AB7F5|nr:enoyl-CoA hydratase-related protein [Vibrio parahaemolyticus]EIV8642661.1 enoyl-CoA hydratase/isomerase family protein [Vibrio parahaemolyticus]EIV8674277.1 enoyl-CoA hydratase/isomerase family protein [Vibrio parahaemolyticus]MBE4282594.1 gamma-carboxygeranoyl-CoA hydratase [Vibrio parahaemolyticus]MCX8923309.1 enoyl-CoA hydratase-related protein [Vibrio parahaemolyticus]HCG8183642.1 enoyl-CoA hydratase/isomerase family protein [Vibrio parahaemolyticus]